MAQTKLVFGEWLPDQPGVTGALTEAKNCIPVTNGYEPMLAEADLSGSAGQTLLTAFAGKYAQTSTLFAAGATQVFKYNNSTRALAAMTTTGYIGIEYWDAAQFGDVMLLANGVSKIQAVDLNTANNFANVAAAAPTAKYITVVRDFVVAANETGFENKVYWSDINDETNWTASATSQSDSQVIADGGDIIDDNGNSVLGGFSGAYADLSGLPTLFDGDYNTLTNKPTIRIAVPTGSGPGGNLQADSLALAGLNPVTDIPSTWGGDLILQGGVGGANGDLYGEVRIKSGQIGANYEWHFTTDKKIKLPAGGDIVNSTGTSVMGGSGSYAPANAGDWAGTAPTTIAEALDRIAARLNGGGTGAP